jgi:chromosomal replication initiator protein
MQLNNNIQLWNKCLEIIKDNIPEQAFDTWFKPIVPVTFQDNKLTLGVPSQFFCEYLDTHFMTVIKPTILRVFGKETKLVYHTIVDQSSGSALDYPADESNAILKKAPQQSLVNAINPFNRPLVQDLDPQLNPRYNFDNYFEGTSNRLVRTAGEQIAENPGRTAFNPLFVYGPSGVGKTHLCNAIGARIRERHPEKRVLYVSAHLFLLQYTDSVRNNKSNDFLSFYQNIDVLIMDDIQELVGMGKTQNTFFHIFNHLHQLGKQLILTSDKAPVDLEGLEDRLITRLKWGLTAELNRPDLELRKKILQSKISNDGIVIPDEVFNFIVANVTENVRDLEGVVVSLMANSVINNRDIDLPLAKHVVGQAVRIEKQKISVEGIQETVCSYFHIEQAAVQTNSRKKEIVNARQVTMYLANKYTDKSLSAIGKIVGKRDHATVLHSCKTVKDQLETNKTFRSSIEEIEQLLKN